MSSSGDSANHGSAGGAGRKIDQGVHGDVEGAYGGKTGGNTSLDKIRAG